VARQISNHLFSSHILPQALFFPALFRTVLSTDRNIESSLPSHKQPPTPQKVLHQHSHGPSSAHDAAPRRAHQTARYNAAIRRSFLLRFKDVLTELQGWFIGHATLLFAVFRYGLSYITLNYGSRWAQFSYRLAFLSAVATYGIVVFKAYKSRVKPGTKPQQVLFMLLGDENVQYLCTLLLHTCSMILMPRSDQLGVAHFPTSPTRPPSIHRLLDLPRRNLHSHEPDPHPPTTQASSRLHSYISDPLEITVTFSQWHWQICQGILRRIHDARCRP
jgi:hypothetical protein